MNERSETQEEPRPPAGVIACLTSAFDLLAHAPYLLLPSVILDLFLWLGPRLSAESLIAPLISAAKAAPNTEMQPLYLAVSEALSEISRSFNLFAVLSPGPLLGTPALMGMRRALESPLGTRAEIPVPVASVSLGWIALLTVLGLGISTVYLAQIGRHVVAHTEAPVPGPASPLRLWGHLLQLAVTGLFLFGGASLAASLVVNLAIMLSQALAGLVTMFFLSLTLFVAVHFIYTIPGMVQLRHPPLRAMQESILLARVDFPGVMQAVLVALVLRQGLNFVWTLPAPESWAALVGIGGHAVISTVLIAALLIFYQERLAYLRLLQNAFARNAAQVIQ